MKNIVIRELDNYRGRTEQRYQIMTKLKFRNGLNHTDYKCYTLQKKLNLKNSKNYLTTHPKHANI